MREFKRVASVRRSGGFSLIELLVAVLVMGIGVLGVTALQMVSLQNNRAALVRAEAVQLAYDMMDRVRANPAGAPPGASYDGLAVGDGPPAVANLCGAGGACSEAQMVTFDQAMWKCQLGTYTAEAPCQDLWAAGLLPGNPAGDGPQAGLPEGDGSVAVDGAGTVTVTVQWLEPDGTTQSVVIDSQG